MDITSETAYGIIEAENRLVLDGDTGQPIYFTSAFNNDGDLAYYDSAILAEGGDEPVVVIINNDDLKTCKWSLSTDGHWLIASQNGDVIWSGRVFLRPSNPEQVVSGI